jgi:hypothetical protein
MLLYICDRETITKEITMFKVIETIETVKHESNNPELETEQVVYSVLLNGCCVGVSIGSDYTDEIIADIVAEKPELAPYI